MYVRSTSVHYICFVCSRHNNLHRRQKTEFKNIYHNYPELLCSVPTCLLINTSDIIRTTVHILIVQDSSIKKHQLKQYCMVELPTASN